MTLFHGQTPSSKVKEAIVRDEQPNRVDPHLVGETRRAEQPTNRVQQPDQVASDSARELSKDTLPDFIVVASIGQRFSIEIINRSAPAFNTEIDCKALANAEVMYPDTRPGQNGEVGDLVQFDIGCASPGWTLDGQGRRNPNKLRPIQAQEVYTTFKELPAYIKNATNGPHEPGVPYRPNWGEPSSHFQGNIEAWFHLFFDDQRGGSHEQFLHLEVQLIPRGDDTTASEEITPSDFTKAMKESYSKWPCVSSIGCAPLIYNALLGR
jgi:hypothetical protein